MYFHIAGKNFEIAGCIDKMFLHNNKIPEHFLGSLMKAQSC